MSGYEILNTKSTLPPPVPTKSKSKVAKVKKSSKTKPQTAAHLAQSVEPTANIITTATNTEIKESLMSDTNTPNTNPVAPGSNVPEVAAAPAVPAPVATPVATPVSTPAVSTAAALSSPVGCQAQSFEEMLKTVMIELVKEVKKEVVAGATDAKKISDTLIKDLDTEIVKVEKVVAPKNPCVGWFNREAHDWIYLQPSKEEEATIDQLLTFGQTVLNPKNGPRSEDLMHRTCRRCFKDENHVAPYIAALKKARGVQ